MRARPIDPWKGYSTPPVEEMSPPTTQERAAPDGFWTLPDAAAQRVLALDEDRFNRELTVAFGARLGDLQLRSQRAAAGMRRMWCIRWPGRE